MRWSLPKWRASVCLAADHTSGLRPAAPRAGENNGRLLVFDGTILRALAPSHAGFKARTSEHSAGLRWGPRAGLSALPLAISAIALCPETPKWT